MSQASVHTGPTVRVGGDPSLTPEQQAKVAAQLEALGLTEKQIAETLGRSRDEAEKVKRRTEEKQAAAWVEIEREIASEPRPITPRRSRPRLSQHRRERRPGTVRHRGSRRVSRAGPGGDDPDPGDSEPEGDRPPDLAEGRHA